MEENSGKKHLLMVAVEKLELILSEYTISRIENQRSLSILEEKEMMSQEKLFMLVEDLNSHNLEKFEQIGYLENLEEYEEIHKNSISNFLEVFQNRKEIIFEICQVEKKLQEIQNEEIWTLEEFTNIRKLNKSIKEDLITEKLSFKNNHRELEIIFNNIKLIEHELIECSKEIELEMGFKGITEIFKLGLDHTKLKYFEGIKKKLEYLPNLDIGDFDFALQENNDAENLKTLRENCPNMSIMLNEYENNILKVSKEINILIAYVIKSSDKVDSLEDKLKISRKQKAIFKEKYNEIEKERNKFQIIISELRDSLSEQNSIIKEKIQENAENAFWEFRKQENSLFEGIKKIYGNEYCEEIKNQYVLRISSECEEDYQKNLKIYEEGEEYKKKVEDSLKSKNDWINNNLIPQIQSFQDEISGLKKEKLVFTKKLECIRKNERKIEEKIISLKSTKSLFNKLDSSFLTVDEKIIQKHMENNYFGINPQKIEEILKSEMSSKRSNDESLVLSSHREYYNGNSKTIVTILDKRLNSSVVDESFEPSSKRSQRKMEESFACSTRSVTNRPITPFEPYGKKNNNFFDISKQQMTGQFCNTTENSPLKLDNRFNDKESNNKAFAYFYKGISVYKRNINSTVKVLNNPFDPFSDSSPTKSKFLKRMIFLDTKKKYLVLKDFKGIIDTCIKIIRIQAINIPDETLKLISSLKTNKENIKNSGNTKGSKYFQIDIYLDSKNTIEILVESFKRFSSFSQNLHEVIK